MVSIFWGYAIYPLRLRYLSSEITKGTVLVCEPARVCVSPLDHVCLLALLRTLPRMRTRGLPAFAPFVSTASLFQRGLVPVSRTGPALLGTMLRMDFSDRAVEWITDELRPKLSVVTRVAPFEVTVQGDYFREGDALLFTHLGCRGIVVAPPVSLADGNVVLSIATRYVTKQTREITHYESVWIPPIGLLEDGCWYDEPVYRELPFPIYRVLNVTPGTDVLCLGPVYAENSSLS